MVSTIAGGHMHHRDGMLGGTHAAYMQLDISNAGPAGGGAPASKQKKCALLCICTLVGLRNVLAPGMYAT